MFEINIPAAKFVTYLLETHVKAKQIYFTLTPV